MLYVKPVKRTFLIAIGCTSFLVGLALVNIGSVLTGWIWPVLAAMLLPLCINRKTVIAVPVVIVAGLVFGIWRGSLMWHEINNYLPFLGTKVDLQGNVVEDPVYDDKGQLDFRLQSVVINDQDLPGQVRIKTFSPIDVKRGDYVEASGKLQEGFGNYQAAIYFAGAKTIVKNKNLIDDVRRQFAASVLTAMPEPQASLGLGFLVGLKSGLPDDLSEQLRILSLTHIVVASGYNLTILVRLARRF